MRRVRTRYEQRGLEGALYDEHRRGRDRLLTVKQEARIIAMVCSSPPHGRSRWTVTLVAHEAVKRKLVQRVGRETIRVLLSEYEFKPWREKNGSPQS